MIMEFVVRLDRENISRVETPGEKVAMFPFTGYVESDLFTGRILPGAVDVQITNAAGIRHMCARYMFEGRDAQGTPCRLFVDNNGYFEPGREPAPVFHTCPVFYTDSPSLGPYLHQRRFRAEGRGTPEGVNIRIFDEEDERG